MTGQDLLDTMEMLHPELELQSGEVDVTRALVALNIAQDQLESILAARPGVWGGEVGTVATVLSTESTSYPSGLLRVDKLQFIDPATSKPAWNLKPIYETGGHIGGDSLENMPGTATGKPSAYWTDGSNIYWQPIPDGAYTVRYYGFKSKTNITADGTFLYPDMCRLPLATLAVKIMRLGVDDNIEGLEGMTQEAFSPVLTALERFRRETGKAYEYSQSHDT